jgi:hypothetical protein
MLVDGVLKVLNMDQHLVPSFQKIHEKALQVCKETGAILDVATSDVALYLETEDAEVAKRVAACYSDSESTVEAPGIYCIG